VQFPVDILVFADGVYVCLVSKFACEKIQPLVREMDEQGCMPDHLIKDLFANGVNSHIIVQLLITECVFDERLC